MRSKRILGPFKRKIVVIKWLFYLRIKEERQPEGCPCLTNKSTF